MSSEAPPPPGTPPLQLVIQSPIDFTVGRPTLRAAATCRGGTGGCVYLEVAYAGNPKPFFQTATGAIDQTISLTRSGLIRFKAVDNAGNRVELDRYLYMDTSSKLVEIATAPFAGVIEASGNRIVIRKDSVVQGIVQLVRRPVPETLWVQTGNAPPSVLFVGDGSLTGGLEARLTPHGAILNPTANGGFQIIEVRDGTTITLSSPSESVGPVALRGKYAMWRTGGNLVRRDLESGVNAVVATGISSNGYILASNGDFVVATSNELHWHHDGVEETRTTTPPNIFDWVLADSGAMGYNVGPATPPPFGAQSSAFTINGREEVLSHGVLDAIEGQWIAWVANNTAGVHHVYTRAPDGTERAVEQFNGTAQLEALTPNGTVVLTADNIRWIAVPPYVSATSLGSTEGRVILRDGQPILLLGGSAFRIIP